MKESDKKEICKELKAVNARMIALADRIVDAASHSDFPIAGMISADVRELAILIDTQESRVYNHIKPE